MLLLAKRKAVALGISALVMGAAVSAVAEDALQPEMRVVQWERAVSHLEACDVEMVVQTHELDVYLNLKNGSRVRAKEPVIDEVFRVVERTRETCGMIPVATE